MPAILSAYSTLENRYTGGFPALGEQELGCFGVCSEVCPIYEKMLDDVETTSVFSATPGLVRAGVDVEPYLPQVFRKRFVSIWGLGLLLRNVACVVSF